MGEVTPLEIFVRESNWIEGIRRDPTGYEMDAHRIFLAADRLSVELFEGFVTMVQSDAVLRDRVGLNVRVGDHIAPLGGPDIVTRLRKIIRSVRSGGGASPYHVHRTYQNLHPFTDGNGRSGRALWLRMMGGPEKAPLGFLHHWYYQSLDAGDRT